MSNFNPYANTGTTALPAGPMFQRVFSNPLELVQRSFNMVKSNYWLLLGVTFVGAILTVFIVTFGPMMVGIFYCYKLHEAGREFEFQDVFRGFDQFLDNFLASLLVLGLSLLLIVPLFIGLTILVFRNNGQMPFTLTIGASVVFGLVGLLIQTPAVFIFPLLSEYRLRPMEAIRISVKAAYANIGSVVANLLCITIITTLLSSTCCGVLGIFFAPISYGWIFLLYRDIFPKTDVVAAI